MPTSDKSERAGGYRALGCAVIAIVITWTIVLPWVGQQRDVRQMIDRNESLGIDPTAMFYTELEHMSIQDGRLRRTQK